mgnify:CR=1 FL=1|tara:strand:- start:64 stop:270 length:207 start_codon:yes stop_codon:yes gene_type:complete
MTIHIKAREINWVAVSERALSTMIQTFLAGWVILDTSSLKTAGLAAVAAGLSVLKNAVREWCSLTEKI